ncbi:flippase-like domain-containing protein, partial [Candidatus Woesearchaeota archaeon]|nr:flippase-like domain-containing protein [Candidatus Woesearchaeota archaeon]
MKNKRSIVSNKIFRFFLGLIIAFVLLFLLFSQISFSELRKAIDSLSISIVLLGALIYFIAYLFRAARFRLILQNKIDFSSSMAISMIHNLVVQVLPARTGELSFLYLAKKRGIRGAEAAATIIIARFFDLLVISFIFLVSALFLENTPQIIKSIVVLVSSLIIIILLIMMTLAFFGSAYKKIMNRLLRRFIRYRIIKYFAEKMEEVISSFHVLKSRRMIIYAFISSVIIWSLIYLMNYLIFYDIAGKVPIAFFSAGVSLTVIANVIPIQGLGNFGTHEAFWTIAFVALGLELEIAILT